MVFKCEHCGSEVFRIIHYGKEMIVELTGKKKHFLDVEFVSHSCKLADVMKRGKG